MMQASKIIKTKALLLILILFLPWAVGGCAVSGQALGPAPEQSTRLEQTPVSPAPSQALEPIQTETMELPQTLVTSTPGLAQSPALGQTNTPTQTMAPSQSPTAHLPKEHYIRAITGHKQYFPLGCETAAAKDWAKYFGKNFNEFEFQYQLPLSDNPDFGFVGNVNSPWGQVPPYAYGVNAGPVADLLNAYGIAAKANKHYTLEQIKAKVAQDKPVIVWVIGNVVGGIPDEYTDSKGNKVIVAAYEHVVIVTGYSETRVRYMNNGKFYETPNEVFLNSWGVLENMVIVDQ